VICVALIFKFMKTYKNKNFDLKKSVKFIFLCIIPILIFVGGTLTYSEINHEKFGVYDINLIKIEKMVIKNFLSETKRNQIYEEIDKRAFK